MVICVQCSITQYTEMAWKDGDAQQRMSTADIFTYQQCVETCVANPKILAMMPCFVVLFFVAYLPSILSSAPWQDTPSTIKHESLYDDLPPTVFTPSGRLILLEQILPLSQQSEDASSNLAVAIECQDGVAIVTSSPQSPYLYENATLKSSLWIMLDEDDDDLSTMPPFCSLSPSVLAVTAGNAVDAQILRQHLEEIAQAARAAAEPLSARVAARRLADRMQSLQVGKGRLLAASAIIADSQIWRVDPTGQFYLANAALIGRGARQGEKELLKIYDKTSKLDASTGRQHATTAIEAMFQAIKAKQRPRLWGVRLSGREVEWFRPATDQITTT
jgi:20S proteasome alpha/beta subunit